MTGTAGQNDILVVTLSNIGDAIMTTPVLQTLHRLYPEETMDMVVDRRSKELFFHCPYRGEVFEKNKKGFLRGFPQLACRLRQKKYHLVVDLRTDVLPFFLRAEKKLGRWNADSKAVHSVEKHLSVIRPIANDNIVDRCCLWTGEDDERFAKETLGGANAGKILCIAPGANALKKIWNWQNYRALINQIHGHFGSILLLGSRSDNSIAEKIVTGLTMPALNLCGKTTLLQAAAIMRSVSLFIGNDSGLGHMAAAAGAPTCTLFGPGQPAKYRPWGDKAVWLTGDNQQINAITASDVISMLAQNDLLV